MYRLLFHSGRFKGRRFAVRQGTLVIGRAPGCQVVLAEDDEVSHEHAQLEMRKDGVWLRDLGALHPATVNGEAASEVKLRPGDRIGIGGTQIEFQLIEASVATPRRKRSRIQMLTLLAVGGILALEAVFIFLFPIWQRDAIRDAERERARLEAEAQLALSAVAQEPESTEEPAAVPEAELQELRDVISGLREQVDSLAAQTVAAAETPVAPVAPPAPEPTAAPEPTPAPPPAVPDPAPPPVTTAAPPARIPSPVIAERPASTDPLADKVRELLLMAQGEARKGNWVAADQSLERLLILSPDFVPGLVERARVHEQRGMLKEAGAAWTQVMGLTTGTPLYATAIAERQRLTNAVAVRAAPRPAPEPAAQASPLERRIRIESIDRERFPGNREFDEMRLARVHLKPRASEGRIDAEDVRVWIVFYDRVAGGAEVLPTRATAPAEPLRIDTVWGAGEAKSATATYIVPRDFRKQEEERTGQKRTYEGCRVQVWYKGVLQDEDAMPKTLLKEKMPAMPESTNDAGVDINAPIRRR